MSNCIINTRKFKQFSLYDYNNPTNLGNCMSSPFGHGNDIQENDVFLVGYQYQMSSCPEIKMKLSDIIDLAQDSIKPISLGFRLDPSDQQVLQFTTEYDSNVNINDLRWQTAVTLPSGGSSCNCDLKLYYDESNSNLYYTLDGDAGLSDSNCLFVPLTISSGGTSTFTSIIDYGATPNGGPTAAFNSDGDFVIHLEPYPTVTGITGVGNLQLTSNGGQWDDASGAINIYTFYDTDGTAFNQTIRVQNGVDGDPGEVPTFEIKSNGHLWATYPSGNSNDLGEVQITNVSGATYGIMNVKDVSLCTAAGDAYIDWNTSSSTYGHLFYYIDVPSNSGTQNNPNPQDLGKIVGPNGIGIDSVVSQGSVTHGSGAQNTYEIIGNDSNRSILGSFVVQDGTDGHSPTVSITSSQIAGGHQVTCTVDGTTNATFNVLDGTTPTVSVSSSNDTHTMNINGTDVVSWSDGANGDTISVSGNTFTVQHSDGSPDSTVTVYDGADGTTIELYRCTVACANISQQSIPQPNAAGLPAGAHASSTVYYFLGGAQTWEKYDPHTHVYVSHQVPSFVASDVVEVGPSDYSPAATALNLLYGTFGSYSFSGSAGTIRFYAINDPSAASEKYSLQFVVKVYKNMQ